MALIARWPFDQSSGTNVPDAVNGFAGTTVGAPNWLPSGGQIGGALQLVDPGQYVDFGNQAALIGFIRSYAFWIWFDSNAGEHAIISKIANTSPFNGLLMEQLGTTINVFIDGGTAKLAAAGFVTTSSWMHAALVLDSGTLRLYKGGSQVATGTYTTVTNPALPFLVGRQNNLATRDLSGRVDEFRVYDHALIPGEVAALAAGAGFGSNPAIFGPASRRQAHLLRR